MNQAVSFYAYTHARPNVEGVDAIFYVGKGKLDRDRDFTHRTFHHKNIVAKHGGRDKIVVTRFPCDSEAEAHRLEKLLIASYRAAGVRLANFTDGGDGLSGHRHSEESKAKISEGNKGKKLSAEHRKFLSEYWKARPCPIAGLKHTDETKAKLSALRKGKPNPSASRPVSEETRDKISATKLAKTGGVSGRYRGAPGNSPEEKAARRAEREAARASRKEEKAQEKEEAAALRLALGVSRNTRAFPTGADNPSCWPGVSEIRSQEAKARWEDAEMRERMTENVRASWTDERKAAFSANNPSHNPEVNAKKSAAMKGYEWKRIECPHCGLVGAEPPMKRYHFDNCKKRETN